MNPEYLKTLKPAELTVMLASCVDSPEPLETSGVDLKGFLARDWVFLEVRDDDVYVYTALDVDGEPLECYVLYDDFNKRWVVAFDY